MKLILTLILTNLFVLRAQTLDNIKNQLNNSGISPEQARQIAKDRGLSDEQIESEIRMRRIEEGNEIKSSENILDDISNNNDLIVAEDNIIVDVTPAINSQELKYFGYQIFQGDPNIFQSSTFGIVDPGYNIGPGDEIIVMLWGESQFRQEFTVDAEGYVFVPDVGQVFVNGLNLQALEKKFFQILSKAYSTLNPSLGNPTTFMDVSLGNLRPLRIIVLGDVLQPGSYNVSPSTSLSSSLYYFNGPTIKGSLRDIRLIRQGKYIGSIDFYDYLLSGTTPNDLRMQLDDIVFLPPRGKTVTILGEINRPGIYELKDNEGLIDLLKISGDLLVSAYVNRAQISRIIPVNQRDDIGMDRILIDLKLKEILENNINTVLNDGDTLKIFAISKNHNNYVNIRGVSINRAGKYQLVDNMSVIDLINEADGLTKDAFLDIAHLHRLNDDLTDKIISINLNEALNGNKKHNIKLRFMDELVIYNKNNINNSFQNVTITGPVKSPGSYPLRNDTKLNDIIVASGSFTSDVKKVKIIVARENENSFNPIIYNFPSKNSKKKFVTISGLSQNDEINQFELKDNDIISLYSDPMGANVNTVNISGEVFYPGDYPISRNSIKVNQILNFAGGLNSNAYPRASSLIRNGNKVKISFDKIINQPTSKQNFVVMPGDSINISSRPNIVNVLGEVLNPGIFQFYKDANIKDYIDIAGGLTVDAEKKEIWITYPDGISKQYKTFMFNKNVYDGSVITVGRKKDQEPFDLTSYALELTSIVANLAQVLILYQALSSN